MWIDRQRQAETGRDRAGTQFFLGGLFVDVYFMVVGERAVVVMAGGGGGGGARAAEDLWVCLLPMIRGTSARRSGCHKGSRHDWSRSARAYTGVGRHTCTRGRVHVQYVGTLRAHAGTRGCWVEQGRAGQGTEGHGTAHVE